MPKCSEIHEINAAYWLKYRPDRSSALIIFHNTTQAPVHSLIRHSAPHYSIDRQAIEESLALNETQPLTEVSVEGAHCYSTYYETHCRSLKLVRTIIVG